MSKETVCDTYILVYIGLKTYWLDWITYFSVLLISQIMALKIKNYNSAIRQLLWFERIHPGFRSKLCSQRCRVNFGVWEIVQAARIARVFSPFSSFSPPISPTTTVELKEKFLFVLWLPSLLRLFGPRAITNSDWQILPGNLFKSRA